jgi:hypothetical protein
VFYIPEDLIKRVYLETRLKFLFGRLAVTYFTLEHFDPSTDIDSGEQFSKYGFLGNLLLILENYCVCILYNPYNYLVYGETWPRSSPS